MAKPTGFESVSGGFTETFINASANKTPLCELARMAPQHLHLERYALAGPAAIVGSTLGHELGRLAKGKLIGQREIVGRTTANYERSLGAHLGLLLLSDTTNQYAHRRLDLLDHPDYPNERTLAEATSQLEDIDIGALGWFARAHAMMLPAHSKQGGTLDELIADHFPGIGAGINAAETTIVEAGKVEASSVANFAAGARIAVASFAESLNH